MFNKGRRVPFPPNMIRGGFVVMLEQKIRINAIHQTIKWICKKRLWSRYFKCTRCSRAFYIPHHPEKKCLRADISGTDSFCLQFVENYTTSCSTLHIYIPVYAIYVCVCQTFGATMHKPNHPPPYITKENFHSPALQVRNRGHTKCLFLREKMILFS